MPTTGPYDALAARDAVLSRLVSIYGRPDPFISGDGGRTGSDDFAGMVLHIVAQQISWPAALTIFDRIAAAAGGRPTTAALARVGADGLRECGLPRARASSLLDLAARQDTGLIDVAGMRGLPDDQVIAVLTSVRGVGVWTAQMFLIHQLRRPDILPAADLGIRHGVQAAWHLTVMPSVRQVQDRGGAWAPYRTFAAALLSRTSCRSLREGSELTGCLAATPHPVAQGRPAK
jgi:DNA-3-methyladenine glycosylase II